MTAVTGYPSLVGCFRLGPAAVLRVLRAPRVLLLVAGTLFVIAVAEVVPVYQSTGELLHHVPGAQGRFGRFLLADLARLHPETQLAAGGSALLAMFLWTFFAGGVLARVGRAAGGPGGVGGFLAACGRFFFRSLRCWAGSVVLLLAWSWLSVDLVAPWLEETLVAGGNEPAQLRFDVAENLVWAAGFALILILRRTALARLVLTERRSVLLAYASAVALLVRRPLATLTAFLGLFVVWAAGLTLCALALDPMFDGDRLVAAFAVGTIAFVWFQCCIAGSFVLARRLWVLDGADHAVTTEDSDPAPAVVDVARTVH